MLDVSLELVKFNLPKSSKRKKLSQVEFANISQLQNIGRGAHTLFPKETSQLKEVSYKAKIFVYFKNTKVELNLS